MKIIEKIIFNLFILLSSSLYATTVFTYYNNSANVKSIYDYQVLKLALDKTSKTYGEYELVSAPKMNKARALLSLNSNEIKNLIVKVSYSKELLKRLTYANFPVDLGVTGYRISFISSKMESKLHDYDTLDKIKTLTFGQGLGWLDVDILEYNGFKVETVANSDGLIHMLDRNRFDFFSRGANEILSEFENFGHLKNITYEKNFLLYYPLPRFFFSHKSNKKAIERIEKGLKIAYEDGSYQKVFNEYFKRSLDFVNIKNRKLYILENPFLKDIESSYERYIYNPFK